MSRPAKITSATEATMNPQMSKKSRLFGNTAPNTNVTPTIAIKSPPAGTIGKAGAQESG
jgi:hypothetical protein